MVRTDSASSRIDSSVDRRSSIGSGIGRVSFCAYGDGSWIDPLAIAIDVPDEHAFAYQFAQVNDRVRVHRPKAKLEVGRRRGAVLYEHRSERREDSIRGWIDDQRRFQGMPPGWQCRPRTGSTAGTAAPVEVTDALQGLVTYMHQDSRRRVLRMLARHQDLFFCDPPVLTRGHIPGLVGTTREMTGNVLRQLEREGIIAREGRSGLRLLHPDLLTT
jgi:Crp-like helix-turn-helix domain